MGRHIGMGHTSRYSSETRLDPNLRRLFSYNQFPNRSHQALQGLRKLSRRLQAAKRGNLRNSMYDQRSGISRLLQPQWNY